MKEFFNACNANSGRWNRQKFWLYPLGMSMLILSPLMILFALFSEVTVISIPLMLALFIAYIYITYVSVVGYVKRLHDLDKSGWLTLLAFVPLANIYLFVICGFFKGTEGKNQYGENPLAATATPSENKEAL